VSNSRARLVNLLGAVAIGLGDAIDESVAGATSLDRAASTALVAMLDFTPAGSVRTLSQVVGLTHSGAVRLVDRLVAAGHVRREPGADARSRAISLTPSGRRTARAARRARQRALEQVVDGLPPHDQDALAVLAPQVVGRLTSLRLEQRAAGRAPAGGALCRLCDFTACGRAQRACPAQRTAGADPAADAPSLR
jgi:DNA-binding MarR family transcriptional regulator